MDIAAAKILREVNKDLKSIPKNPKIVTMNPIPKMNLATLLIPN